MNDIEYLSNYILYTDIIEINKLVDKNMFDKNMFNKT